VNEAARVAIERALGVAVVQSERVGGGDINDAYRLTLADGRSAFAKYNPVAPPQLF
jgi:hypothetical protein